MANFDRFDPYKELIDGPQPDPFANDRDVVNQTYKDDRAKGLIVEPTLPPAQTPGEQLRDLIYNAEGLSDADKNALANTAVNALSSIIKQTPTETFQPRSAVSHVNRR